MKTIVYGRQAYEGFAKAIGWKLGLNVSIDNGARAAINKDGAITLPGMNTYQTAQEFAETCGTVVHEMAHQFYSSHKLIDPKRSRLEHECLNAVLDVADETWISKWFEDAGNKRPGELLTRGNQSALAGGALFDWNNTETHLWKILCTGILDARLTRNRRLNQIKQCNARNAAQAKVNAYTVWNLIRRAKASKSQNVKPTMTRFKKLIGLALAVAAELAPYAPPEGQAVEMGSGLPAAIGKGSASKPAGAVEATSLDGADVATGKSTVGGETGDAWGGYQADPATFRLVHPPVARIARRIAVDGDGADFADGLRNGPRLGEVHRLLTDGNCLARWTENDHAEGVSASIILDCSGSMNSILGECAGIARAFSLAMAECGPVQSLIFGTICKETNSFEKVQSLGGTNTSLAVAKATDWLKGRRGSKWIVCITDGQPNDQDDLNARCHEAHNAGIRVLAIGLNCHIDMPHATCVTAKDVNHLAIELEVAARKIECQ